MNVNFYIQYLLLGLIPCLASAQRTTFSNLESKAFEIFLDSLVEKEMEAFHVPGTSMVFINDSQTIIKSYGKADIENEIKVNRDRTGFRVASITKTLTSIAVLQLVDRGVLDLHTDIRQYLPGNMDHLFPKGMVTIHQLLTHIAGYDMTDINDAALSINEVLPIEEVLRNLMPAQVFPPGEVYSYSNFGFTLAGLIIQQVSGTAYSEYIKENILDPLEMSFSSVAQPLPGNVKNNIAESYLWKDSQVRYERDFSQVTPADGLVTSAADMANYMKMLLNKGSFNGVTILSESSFDLLITQQYGARGTEFGICYAFFEGLQKGYRSLEHTGGQLGFASLLVLIPEVATGIFITHNSREGANAFRYRVMNAVLDTLLQEKSTERSVTNIGKGDDLEIYNGYFKQMNYPRSSFEKIGLLFGVFSTEWKVKELDEVLTINGSDFSELGDGLFISKDYPDWKVAFEKDGKALKVMSGTSSYKKIPWYKRTIVSQILLMPALIFLLIMFIARPIKSIIRKVRKPLENPERDWVYEWLYFTGSILIISFLVILLCFMLYEGQLADYGIPVTIKSSLVFNSIAGVLSVLSPLAIYKVLTSSKYSKWRKLFYCIGIVSVIIVAIGFFHFNLMAME